MKEDVLIAQFISKVIEENAQFYLETLKNFDSAEVSDNYWLSLITLYRKLSTEDRKIIENLIRQVSIDTASNIFGIIDGTIDFPIDIKLVNYETGEVFEDELQDQFLSILEEEQS